MNIMVIGSGGREHAIAWACARSPMSPKITCIPGNGGTVHIAQNINLPVSDLDGITSLARDREFDLVIVGPEAPLVDGLADRLRKMGVPVFGPSAQAAMLEGSKAFAKRLMAELGLTTPQFEVFTDKGAAEDYIRGRGAPIIVKASGLAAGKGAIVCRTVEDALAAAEAMLQRDAFGVAGREIVVEECLEGRELSLLAIVDGEDFVVLPPSRDHKRALDGDRGPNTGGMGAYAPVEDLTDAEVVELAGRLFPPVLARLAEVDTPYSGCLYAGLMLTADGPFLLEFNCRLGDPEAQAVLPLLATDPLELMCDTAEHKLKGWTERHRVERLNWRTLGAPLHALTVVAAMDGYPGAYPKGVPITSLPDESASMVVFHAGTEYRDGNYYTTGGRVLNVTGIGESPLQARENAYAALEQVSFQGMRYRHDIGGQAIR